MPNKKNYRIIYLLDVFVLIVNYFWITQSSLTRFYICVPAIMLPVLIRLFRRGVVSLDKYDMQIIGSLLVLLIIQEIHILIQGNILESGDQFTIWMLYTIAMYAWSRGISKEESKEYSLSLFKILIFILALATAISLPTLVDNYGIIRSYSSDDVDLIQRLSGVRFYVGSWLQYTSVAIVFPLFLFWTSEVKHIILYFFLVIIGFACAVTSLSSVMFYIVMSIVLFIIFNPNIKGTKKIISIVVLMLLFIVFLSYMENYYSILVSNQGFFENAWDKLVRLITGIFKEGRTGDSTGRFATKLDQTILSIKDHWLFGVGYGNPNGPAGHMHILDTWGWFGILGELSILTFFIATYKKIKKAWNEGISQNIYRGILFSWLFLVLQSITGGILFSYMLGLFLICMNLLLGEGRIHE